MVKIALVLLMFCNYDYAVEINLSVNWSKLSTADKDTYARDTDVHLNAVKVAYQLCSTRGWWEY